MSFFLERAYQSLPVDDGVVVVGSVSGVSLSSGVSVTGSGTVESSSSAVGFDAGSGSFMSSPSVVVSGVDSVVSSSYGSVFDVVVAGSSVSVVSSFVSVY